MSERPKKMSRRDFLVLGWRGGLVASTAFIFGGTLSGERQQNFQNGEYEIRDPETGRKVNLLEFKGQKLVVLLFVAPTQGSAHRNYLDSILEAREKIEFKPIFIYSQNELPDEETEVRSLIKGEDRIYLLTTMAGVKPKAAVRPGTDSPEIYLIDKDGVIKEHIWYRELTSKDLVDKVAKLN
jgi:hypothetical protein